MTSTSSNRNTFEVDRFNRSAHFFKTATVLFCALSAATLSIAADSEADNTKRNQNDESALTPIDQSNDPADLKIASAIRKSITSDDNLSVNAKNLKIVVRRGAVTLRGPVENTDEKVHIEQLVKNTVGVVSVDSQITAKH